jgi:transposase InsO family protein
LSGTIERRSGVILRTLAQASDLGLYNPRTRHSSLDYRSPAEYEKINKRARAA